MPTWYRAGRGRQQRKWPIRVANSLAAAKIIPERFASFGDRNATLQRHMEAFMLTECSYCQARVCGEVLSTLDESEEEGHYRVSFLRCPSCSRALVGRQLWDPNFEGDGGWGKSAVRVYPKPDLQMSMVIPPRVRKSLEEADRCYHAALYPACAVMAGRAIEAMCCAHQPEGKPVMLAAGLSDLLERGVIDKRLYEWGESLRKERNIGAHASKQDVSRLDARDVLDFAVAICEYVYVLADRYEAYQARKQGRPKGVKIYPEDYDPVENLDVS